MYLFKTKYQDFTKNKGKFVEIDKWKASEYINKKILPKIGFIPFPIDEVMMLFTAVIAHKPKLIFEWGTHIGKSAWIFSQIAYDFLPDTKIVSIDLPESVKHIEHPHSERGKLVRNRQNVELLLGDGVITSIEYLEKNIVSECNILFFLDGDHEYKSVNRELRVIMKKCPLAWILVHDTFMQSKASQYNIGPYVAIKSCLKKYPNYQVYSTSFGLPGMSLLIPIGSRK